MPINVPVLEPMLLPHSTIDAHCNLLLLHLQVALALAVADDSVAFELCDLHWGNVMLLTLLLTVLHCPPCPAGCPGTGCR
jgi:hypothetical protein